MGKCKTILHFFWICCSPIKVLHGSWSHKILLPAAEGVEGMKFAAWLNRNLCLSSLALLDLSLASAAAAAADSRVGEKLLGTIP